jgi:hemoglobin
MARESMYDFAGGETAFLALAAATHERCLADPELNHPFSHPDLRPDHVERLGYYLAEVFGGPSRYTGGHSAMLSIHAGEGIGAEFGERFVQCFMAGADDAGLPDDTEFRNALRAYIEWASAEVIDYSPEGSQVTAGLPMPRWSWDGLQ